MAFIQDLQPCSYLPVEDTSNFLAVGWLEYGKPYNTGTVNEDFFAKLCRLIQSPWQPFASAGVHHCTLCQFSGGSNAVYQGLVIPGRSGDNLFVPGTGMIYVAPIMIAHYIDAHRYQPPSDFIQAVMACPEMRSMAYLKLLLANGGRKLIQ